MTALERALADVARFLSARDVPYMVIGGIANLVWGEPRATLDVDVSIEVDEPAWPGLIHELGRVFHLVPRDPLAFLRDTHVLPVETRDRVRIDLIWARLPYERHAIARARVKSVAGCRVRICRPEDLIIHKIVSERFKDRDDVRALVRRQGARLDRRYLTQRVRVLSRALDQPDLLRFLQRCFRETVISKRRLESLLPRARRWGTRKSSS